MSGAGWVFLLEDDYLCHQFWVSLGLVTFGAVVENISGVQLINKENAGLTAVFWFGSQLSPVINSVLWQVSMLAPFESKVTSQWWGLPLRQALDSWGQARSKTILYKIFKLLIYYPFCHMLISLSIPFHFFVFQLEKLTCCGFPYRPHSILIQIRIRSYLLQLLTAAD